MPFNVQLKMCNLLSARNLFADNLQEWKNKKQNVGFLTVRRVSLSPSIFLWGVRPEE